MTLARTLLRKGSCGLDIMSVVSWNDAQTRKKSEVVAAFDRAIEEVS